MTSYTQVILYIKTLDNKLFINEIYLNNFQKFNMNPKL